MDILELVIYAVPKTIRSICPFSYKKYKNFWLNKIDFALKNKGIFCFSSFKIEFIVFTNRFLDYDNFVFSLKPIMDSLVEKSILINDNYARSGPWSCIQIKSKNDFKTIIKITGEKKSTDIFNKKLKKETEINEFMNILKNCYYNDFSIEFMEDIYLKRGGKKFLNYTGKFKTKICYLSILPDGRINAIKVYDKHGKRIKFSDKMIFKLKNKIKIITNEGGGI